MSSIGPLWDAGFAEGIAYERKRILKWLEGIDHLTIDDWGLNATGNIIEGIEAGRHADPGPSEGPDKP
jgi:hypothetical protein